MDVKREKPTVGQTLFSRAVGNFKPRGGREVLTEVVVTRVGRTYFECRPPKWNHGTSYRIDTWAEKTDGMANSRLYASKEEFDADVLEEVSRHRLVIAFGHKSAAQHLPVEAILKIVAVLDEHQF